jgi:hypothetical protein
MDIPTKTSQDIWSLTEGALPPTPGEQSKSETTGAPGPVTEPIKGEITKIDALQTTQQKAGEHHDVEGEN